MTIAKKWIKRGLVLTTSIFICMNIVAAFHAYKFTHFANQKNEKTQDPTKLSTVQKLSTLILGVSNPRPENKFLPSRAYETIKLKGKKSIECWSIKTQNSKGTVIVLHGFGGTKSSMLDKSAVFLELGYNTLLVDFMGSGGSEGIQTTIGFMEAEQVKLAYDYLVQTGEKNILCFGTSMGAVAAMKAIHDLKLKPKGIIIECPFGSMYETVCARFHNMNVPSFPMAGLLVFWGGVQNGFWAFDHNPIDYAKGIQCPTLLLYGAKDDKVSRNEIDQIYTNLAGAKHLKIYEEAGHENYLRKYRDEWVHDVNEFLQKTQQ